MKKRVTTALACAGLLAFSGCTNSLYTAILSETQAVKAAGSAFFPSRACVDKASTLRIVFGKSMDPASLSLSGSMSGCVEKLAWSTTRSENDTLSLSPKSAWAVDASLGGATASLDIAVKDGEGWACEAISWRPEILEGVVFVSADKGTDSESGAGSARKPFKSLRYAMRAIEDVYPSSAAELRIAGGSYSSLTDDGPVIVRSPLSIVGGYDPEDWSERDPSAHVTEIYGEAESKANIATVVFSGAAGASLDGLRLLNGSYVGESSSDCIAVYIHDESSVSIKDCLVKESCMEEGFGAQAILVSGGCSLALADTTIDMMANTDETVCAVYSKSPLVMKGCSIAISDTMYDTSHEAWGLLLASDAVVEDSTVLIEGAGKAKLRGIIVDSDGAPLSGHVTGSIVVLGTAYQTPALAYGIQCEELSGFSIERSIVNVKAGAAASYGIDLSSCKDCIVQNVIVHGGEGAQSHCVYSYDSSGTRIINNSLYLGASSKSSTGKAYGIRLASASSLAACRGNILCANNPSNWSEYYSVGIRLETEADALYELECNVFAGMSLALLYTNYNSSAYPASEAGLASLNADCQGAHNLFYRTMEELGLADFGLAYPLRPGASTPSALVSSGLTSAPEADAYGKLRDAPYSIGAYEY